MWTDQRRNVRGIAVILLTLAILAAGSISVNAADPSGRCDACRLVTPRPVPTVIGLPRSTPAQAPITGPAVTVPPTDTER